MAAAQFDIVIEENAKYERVIEWQHSDGQPVDLTNYTALMQIRPDAASPTVRCELSTENGRIFLNWEGVPGKIRLFIPTSATSTFNTWTDGSYDLFVFDATGEGSKLLKGRVKIEVAVSRPTV